MRTKIAWPLAAACAAVLALSVQLPSAAQQNAAGRDRFVEYGCWQCHGYDGQGSQAGPRIAPSLLPYAAFERLVRHPANQMPAYAPSALPDAILREIHGYVTSVEEPPALDDIPALQ